MMYKLRGAVLFFSSLGLKAKLSGFIVALIILPYAAMSLYLLLAISNVSSKVQVDTLKETSKLVDEDLLHGVITRAQIYDLTLKTLIVDLEDIKTRIAEDGYRDKLLTDYFYKHQQVSNIYFISPDNRIYLAKPVAGMAQGGQIDTTTLYGYDTVAQSFTGKWVGPYEDGKTKQQVMSYFLPVLQGNKRIGTLAFDFKTSDILTKITPIDPSQSSYVAIVRGTGEILTDSNQFFKDLDLEKTSQPNIQNAGVVKELGNSKLFLDPDEQQGTFAIHGNTSSQKVVALGTIPSLGGKLVVVSPLAEIIELQTEKAQQIQQTVRQVGTTVFIYMLILGIVVVLASYFISERGIIHPINRLKKGIEDLKGTDFSSRIAVSSHDEIGQLTVSFNSMAAGLEESNTRLQQSYQAIQQKISQLHDEQIKLQASVNSLSLGFIMVDRDHNMLNINTTAKKLFCGSPGSQFATIENCTLIHIADQLKSVIDLRNVIDQCFAQKRALVVQELWFRERSLKIIITPIITVGVIGAAILIDDITEAKILERSKDEFFSIASHELRTPLTAIRGNSSMIKDFYSEKIKDPPELSDMVNDIHESSIRLIGIVNDFLDLSRLEQGKMVFTKTVLDLDALIASIVKEYQPVASQKQLALTYAHTVPSPHVSTDEGKIKQVIINFLGNSLKFTQQGSITITTQVTEGFIKVLVSDTGRGISAQNQNLLFRKFQQANSSLLTRDTTKGTGLGLYISKLIIEGLGGKIKLESTIEGKGSTFSFTLPLAMPAL